MRWRPPPGTALGVVLSLLAVAGAGLPGTSVRADGGARSAQRRGREASHRSLTAGMSCAECHTPEGWEMAAGAGRGSGFDHARTGFPLAGRHGNAACAACHQGESEVRQDCASCHRSPHQARTGDDCARCHSPWRWEAANAIVLHQRTRLPLTGAHLLADCTECHRRTAERQLTSPPSDCVACHERDVRAAGVHPDHLGRAAAAPFPRDCSLCHRATGWSPAFSALEVTPIHGALTDAFAGGTAPADHELRFPLRRGAHRGLACRDCHRRPAVPRDLRCVGCHAHRPAALIRDHGNRPVVRAATACLACHPGGQAR